MKKRIWGITFSIFTIMILFITSGCGSTSVGETSKENGDRENKEELTSIGVQLGWFPEPEYGGEYAAYSQGFFEGEGLEVEITAGGPQVSSLQIVASGDTELGLTKADQLLLAREEGLPVVAIAGVLQNSPQALIYHIDQNIQTFDDLNNRTVFFVPGVPAYEYAKYKHDLNLNEQISDGSLVRFINDESSLLHGYSVSEPAILEEQGIEVDYILLSETGYNPYDIVVFTTENFLEEHPDTVRAYLRALNKGWEYYRKNYEVVNEVIHEKNPELSVDVLNRKARDYEEFVFGGDAEKEGFGAMKEERWEKSKEQLMELGELNEKTNVLDAFTTDFLEGAN